MGGQCFKGKCSGSDYRKACGKKAGICDVPLSFTEEGEHLGLFWGRVDEERPMMSADGKGLAIMWRDEEGKKSAREILARDDVDGWHPFCTHPGCRTADWDAPLKTTVPRKKKGGSKKKKKKVEVSLWLLQRHCIETDDGLIDAYVDGDGTAFDMDGEELGEYNAETNEIE